jgi:hypothetical protein
VPYYIWLFFIVSFFFSLCFFPCKLSHANLYQNNIVLLITLHYICPVETIEFPSLRLIRLTTNMMLNSLDSSCVKVPIPRKPNRLSREYTCTTLHQRCCLAKESIRYKTTITIKNRRSIMSNIY